MSQYKDIPQPTDQRNVSQNDILVNFEYLSTPLNPRAGVANGVLPVDHFATGDNVANPTDGFHKQISWMNRATPANLTNAINGQNSSSIMYPKADGAGVSQARLLNSQFDAPVTYLMASVNFDATGAIIGNAFNVTSVTRSGAGRFIINFANNLSSVNYQAQITTETNATGTTVPTLILPFIGAKAQANLSVRFVNIAAPALDDPTRTDVFVYGFF